MKIESIYIACYRYDLRYTRILVASIRHWHPDVAVYLIKDHFYGAFDTSEIESVWKVGVLKTVESRFGWGFSKLEPLFLPGGKRCLVLDSDIVFAGPVLDLLEKCPYDFVVQHEDPSAEFVTSHYFDLAALKRVDPEFAFPGFTFNTGQIVATNGILNRKDFNPFVTWDNPPKVLHPDLFKFGEQGLLNYVLMKKAQTGDLSIARLQFMKTPVSQEISRRSTEDGNGLIDLAVDDIRKGEHRPYLIHWCGLKKRRLAAMNRGDILLYFENQYYAAIPFGALKKWWRNSVAQGEEILRCFARNTMLHRWWRQYRNRSKS